MKEPIPKFNVDDQVVSDSYLLISPENQVIFRPISGKIVKINIYKTGILYDILTKNGLEGCPESFLRSAAE